MFDRLKKLFRAAPATPVSYNSTPLWEGAVTAEFPSTFNRLPDDEEGTINFSVASPKSAEIRLTLLASDGEGIATARDLVRQEGERREIAPTELDDKTIVSYEEPLGDPALPTFVVRYWLVGGHSQLVLMSVTMDQRERNDAVLADLDRVARSIEFSDSVEFVETATGVVQARKTTLGKAPEQRFSDLDERTLALVNGMAEEGRLLVAKYANSDGADLYLQLDRAYARWAEDPAADKPPPEEAVDAFGALFGHALCDDLEMQWIIMTDEYGTALAVRHPRNSITGFPIESVRKRFESGETGFFAAIATMLRKQITNPDE